MMMTRANQVTQALDRMMLWHIWVMMNSILLKIHLNLDDHLVDSANLEPLLSTEP
jgi:hypothetical protein